MNIINKQQTRTFHRLVKGSSLNALVREMGLEPIRRRHTHLKRACLPIPALALNVYYYIHDDSVCQQFFSFY